MYTYALILLAALLIGALAVRTSIRASRLDPIDDSIGLLGAEGIATSTFTREGHVMVKGELWKATSSRGIIERGAAVQVVGYRAGLTLEVTPLQAQGRPGGSRTQ